MTRPRGRVVMRTQCVICAYFRPQRGYTVRIRGFGSLTGPRLLASLTGISGE